MADYSDVVAAFAAGMAASEREQAAMADPMGSAEPLVSADAPEQPYSPPEPDGGVT